jgi:hypothetical protein
MFIFMWTEKRVEEGGKISEKGNACFNRCVIFLSMTFSPSPQRAWAQVAQGNMPSPSTYFCPKKLSMALVRYYKEGGKLWVFELENCLIQRALMLLLLSSIICSFHCPEF